jgi:hypothetical protein
VLGFGPTGGTRSLVASVLVAFELAVLLTFAPVVRAAWAELQSTTIGGGRSFVLALAGGAVLATAVNARPALFPLHVALTAVFHALGALALLGAAQMSTGRVDATAARVLDSPRTRWGAAVVAGCVAFALHLVVFDGIPHIPDEVVYLLQAGYLSRGNLYLTDVPAAALDLISTTTVDGRWFGIFPVGWPALLSVGVAVGAPGLVNPMLSAAVLLATHGLVRRLWDLRTANLTCVLLATSPWFLFLGASFMAHTAAILFGILATRGAVEIARRGSSGWAVGGGVALGVLVLIRPFEGVLVGLLCAAVVLGSSGWRTAFSGAAVAFAFASLMVGALVLPYNAALTGDALLDPITLYFNKVHYAGANRLGFGANVGNVGWANDALPGHSPFEALINANWNTSLVQLELFGWAFGSLTVLLLALAAGRRFAWSRPAGAALMTVLGVVAAYSLYWYSAADFGARYWSAALVPLATLTAATLLKLGSALLLRLAMLASILGAPVTLTMRSVIKYDDYRGMTREMEQLARDEGFARDLVLVRGDVFSDVSGGLILNPPALEGPGPLYFREVGGQDLERLRERFPGRRLWVVDGPSITRGAPRVVSGPTP